MFLNLNKEDGVDRKMEQLGVDLDTNEEEMKDVKQYEERERHWSIVFEDNDGGVDNEKALLHAKRWYVHMKEKWDLIKSGYSMEVSGSDGNKDIWEVVDYHVV